MMRFAKAAVRWFLSNWHEKGMLFFLGLFLYQYVVWFDFYWVNETRPVVEAALAAAFVLGWLFPKRGRLRLVLAAAACMYATHVVVDPEPIGDLSFHPMILLLAAVEYVLQLSPFLWFAAGTWAIYSLCQWYLRTKWRVFSFMTGSVVLFCIVDSFSTFVLWEQVAIMIGSGMVMLVIQHLKHLKLRDPNGYGNLMNYPVPITLMIITIISATLALGVLAPNIRPIVMDPYTAWKTYQGEHVPVFGSGLGLSGLSTNIYSGYSRNDLNLGGAFQFDYSPVFTVDSTRRSYWRGETRSYYNSSGWEPTQLEQGGSIVPLRETNEFPEESRDNGLETMEVIQTFRMADDSSYPVLFSAPFAEKVETTDGNGNPVNLERAYWQLNQRAIVWSERPGVPYPQTYTVTSQMPVIDEEKLRQAEPVSDQRRLRPYLQLPDELPERVRELAARVTAYTDNPYDQAKALQNYLSVTFPYTNQPDLSKGTSPDFVDSFLFEIQEGYCDYYATAMVVMARTLGLPARWVKGYVSGESSSEMIYEEFLPGEQLNLDGPDTFTVRNSDAHSWAEVYFAGFGWIPFEPTAGFSMPVMYAASEEASELPLESAEESTAAESETDGQRSWTSVFVAAAVSAAIAGALVYMAIRFHWLTLLRTRSFRNSPNYGTKFLADMERLLIRFRQKGMTWGDHETIREIMQRSMNQHRGLKKDMEVLLSMFEKAKYSGSGLTEEEYANAELRIRNVRESL